MSGFDDNPFGEPIIDDPFTDLAIQQATRTTKNAQNSLEDYNPFEKEQHIKPHHSISSTSNVAVFQPQSQNISTHQTNVSAAATPNTSVQITAEELKRRQEDLDRKAAELDQRERRLQQGNLPQLNNWPPLPENFCLKPCFYQDIELEIPSEFQQLVRHLYYTWMFYTLTMCLNIIGGLLIVFNKGHFTTFGLAIFYTLLFTPISYVCWFRPAYKAFRNDSSFNFVVFFCVYFFQTMLSVFQAVGFQDSGYCGFITAIAQFDSTASGIIIGILLLCIAFCFMFTAAANIMMITKIHRIYRSTGASVAKAQAEFATEFMRNQQVQQVATNAVSSAINAQMNNPRY